MVPCALHRPNAHGAACGVDELAARRGPLYAAAVNLDLRLSIVLLAVADLPRALRFYRDAFGWPQTVDAPVYAELELPGGQRLGLYAHEGFARNLGEPPALAPPGRVTGTELYFHAADVPAAIARIEAAGARLVSPLAPRGWGDEAAYFADPDGNVLVVARPIPPAAP